MFDIEALRLILREGCSILGSKGCGKSNLGFWLASLLMFNGARVKVFDSSLVWKKKSSVPYWSKQFANFEASLIYDLSRLRVREMQEVVNQICEQVFMSHVEATDTNGTMVRPTVMVFEEIQQYLPTWSLRSKQNDETSRLVCQGRNYNLGFIAISQKPQLVDSNIVELSGLRFFGKCEGDRTKVKLRSWLNKVDLWKLSDLRLGEFYQQIGTTTTLVQVPKFQAKTKPTQLIPVPKKSLMARLFSKT